MRGCSQARTGAGPAARAASRAGWSGGAERARRPTDGAPGARRCASPPAQHHDLVLEISDRPLPDAAARPGRGCGTAPRDAWADGVPATATTSIAPRDVRHSYAVLRGLTSRSGAHGRRRHHLAARARRAAGATTTTATPGSATSATPARPSPRRRRRPARRRGRLRRATGCSTTAPDLAPAYTVDGDPVPERATSRPARLPGRADAVGNRVNGQFQLDAFGEALLLFAAAAGRDRLDADGWRAAEAAVDAIEQRWSEPDAGIWELDDRRWAHSRLTCVAGLRAVAPPRRAGARGRRLGGAGRRDPGRRLDRTACTRRPLAARPRRPAGRRRPAAAGDPRRRARRRPAQRRHHRTRSSTSWPRTATSTGSASDAAAAARGRGRVPALRLPPGAGRAPAGRRGRAPCAGSSATAAPRTAGPVHRGVRRRPAPAARQPAAGVRPRAPARDRPPPDQPAEHAGTRPERASASS